MWQAKNSVSFEKNTVSFSSEDILAKKAGSDRMAVCVDSVAGIGYSAYRA